MTEMSIWLLSSLMQGKTTLFQYFGLGACLYKLLYLRETVFSPNCSSCSEICGSLLVQERPIRGHVGHIEEINDTIR